ncbi:MGMT family protein [Vibrio sp. JC009]|uniref:MGMT family protein n=1 Tax=Vibrio sp. JC009 TaxID=2912314 RepID=UPI0023AFD0DF|nr:MGMT family protein [Vibrio sp. JC009]WED20860.1 MGMT family protein [Vibrio sp. JC009]
MEDFLPQIYAVIHQIPYGKVTSYGEIARLAGYPGYARHVGKALGKLPEDTMLPWHRVLNSQGKISLTGDSFIRQKERLESEGVGVNSNGKVSLKLYKWAFASF